MLVPENSGGKFGKMAENGRVFPIGRFL